MNDLNKKLIFLIVEDQVVLKKESCSKQKILIKYGKTNKLIYLFSPAAESKDSKKYKKGFRIPYQLPFDLILIKRKDPVINRSKYESNEFIFKEEFVTNWSKKIDQEKINQVELILKRISSDRDVYYRCYHNSFKMYRMRDYSFQLFHSLNYLMGQAHSVDFTESDYGTLIESLDLYHFIIKMNMKKVESIQFTNSQNNPPLWFEDCSSLIGSVSLLEKTLHSFIRFSKDYVDKKGIFFDKDRVTLNDYEALVIDCFKPLSGLRGSRGSIDQIMKLVIAGA